MRAIRLALGTRTLAVFDGGRPAAFAALDLGSDPADLGGLYVLPGYPGRGIGRALTQAAISTARDLEDLWICADDEDRPKHLYHRLGFQPVIATTEFLRLP